MRDTRLLFRTWLSLGPIKGAMTLFSLNPFCKCIVMPNFRIVPKFWGDFFTENDQSVLDKSLFKINTLTKCRVMPLIAPNTQPKCATVTLFPHMPLFWHQRVSTIFLWIFLRCISVQNLSINRKKYWLKRATKIKKTVVVIDSFGMQWPA